MSLTPATFLLALGAALAALYAWAFRALPAERWQFLAAYPARRDDGGTWRGVNLTFYGVFSANAFAFAAAVAVLLLGALGVPLAGALVALAVILALCMPAARVIARVVEGTRHGFTVGGASFVGVLVAPWLALGVERWVAPALGFRFPALAAVAVMGVAYAYGEGMGRLACLSFGCCYGRRLDDAPAALRRLLGWAAVRFTGPTKKIAYASRMEGVRVLPVQAATAVVCTAVALASTWALLAAHPRGALLVAGLGTQLWRFGSEWLRADDRGGGRLSAYQVMALVAAAYLALVAALLPAAPPPAADVAAGLRVLWAPGTLLLLQGLWLVAFLYTGRSTATTSQLRFSVVRS